MVARVCEVEISGGEGFTDGDGDGEGEAIGDGEGSVTIGCAKAIGAIDCVSVELSCWLTA